MLIYYIFPAIVFPLLTVLIMERYTDSFYWYGIVAFIINSLLAFSYYFANKIIKLENIKTDIYKHLITFESLAITRMITKNKYMNLALFGDYKRFKTNNLHKKI